MIGIPVLAILLVIGWLVVRRNVLDHTNGRIKAVWSNDGPTYPGLTPDELDPQNDPGTNPIDPEAN